MAEERIKWCDVVHSNKHLESIKCGERLDQLSDYQCLQKYPAALVFKEIFGFWICVAVHELWQSSGSRIVPADPQVFPPPLEVN